MNWLAHLSQKSSTAWHSITFVDDIFKDKNTGISSL